MAISTGDLDALGPALDSMGLGMFASGLNALKNIPGASLLVSKDKKTKAKNK
jgi:hypothetical protein